MLDRYKVIKKTKPNSFYSIPIYAGLEHRAAFPSQSETAAGMRVTEVRKAGWHIKRRPKINSYDEYGQRVYIKYGNGVETNYTYDENMRWLKHIGTENKYGTQYQNINYSFDDVGNVLGYKNDCMNGARYSTEQKYSYDALYQLIKAEGVTEDNPYAIPDSPDYTSTYTQNFSFDAIGNMTYKDSKETINPAKRKSGGDDLNYEFTYQYDANYAHRLTRAGSEQKGWRYYTYDANGNVTSESDGVAPNEDTTTLTPVTVTTHTNEAGESVYEADYAWAWPWSDSDTGSGKVSPNNKRIYEWNSRNLLMRSVALGYDTRYAYGADGNRAAKWTAGNLSETLYFNTMWTWHIEKGLSQEQQGQYSKHIYLGETRIVTKQTSDLEEHYGQSEELRHQYYYHPDHLGSAQLITDYEGNEYQRIEYTPYGELWVEKKTANEKDMRYLPYKFTAKEQDEETGLYYYGARYLDAKYSRWLSADPAVGEYIPQAGGDNAKLPNGGMYNYTNLSLYHYSNNNPIKYTDPDGNFPDMWIMRFGIEMLPKQGNGFLYFDNTQPQRIGGYYDFYEKFTSNNVLCNIDSLRTNFINSKGTQSSIWLWKGNYNMALNGGWHIGAEIGAYTNGRADDTILESASFTLIGQDGFEITDRTVEGQFWINAFKEGKQLPSGLKMTATLNFKNEADAKAYAESFNKRINGRDNEYFSSRMPNGQDRQSSSVYRGKAAIVNKTVTIEFE